MNLPGAPASLRESFSARPPASLLRFQRGSVLGALFKWLALSALALVLLSCLAVLMLRWVPPFSSAFMLEARIHATLAGNSRYRTDFEWVNLEQISPNAAVAVIASEDQQFPFHAGFDFKSIRESVRASEHGKKLRGASTISQQVAKNLFLWPGGFVRKAFEAYFTVLIETCWPKRRILEIYLNIAEFGFGIYGAEAAAQHFFHKPAAHLTRSDAAILAAVLPSPEHYSASQLSPYVQRRREWILEQMQALGGPEMLNEIDAYPTSRH